MDEVVVNGMFTQNKNSYTGSVTTIKSEDILAVSNTNLLKAISILSPGLRIVEDKKLVQTLIIFRKSLFEERPLLPVRENMD